MIQKRFFVALFFVIFVDNNLLLTILMKRRLLLSGLVMFAAILPIAAQNVTIDVNSTKVDGIIDSKLYGQLFEHIYFSASNGVWQEMLFERSFEPEHFPGITPRDGYFDGWYMDDNQV